jgi:hypothetical protein
MVAHQSRKPGLVRLKNAPPATLPQRNATCAWLVREKRRTFARMSNPMAARLTAPSHATAVRKPPEESHSRRPVMIRTTKPASSSRCPAAIFTPAERPWRNASETV